MSAPQAIVHTSSDGIVLASAQGTIDYVNPALSEMLRLSPEELLGQRLTILFEEAHRAEIDAQLRPFQDYPSNGDLFDGGARCLRGEDAAPVLCQVCVLALLGDDREVTDLLLIVKDITEAHKQQIASQAAKAASEELLFMKDVTAVVRLALMMFLDIMKLSEFSSTLTRPRFSGRWR
jgi:PAS domain S-box-containing protein